MTAESLQVKSSVILERQQLEQLLQVLEKRGFEVIGPTIRDGAIVYDRLTSAKDLPSGWTDEQDGGKYRLKRRKDEALFGYAVGPHSWKKFLHPPVQRLWSAKRDGASFQVQANGPEAPKYAFVGVRSCELHAIAIQDKVFLGGQFVDPIYKSRRQNLFIVAINCGQAGGTCFCASMHTGPKATFGYDLALTEVLEDKRHYFVVEVGTGPIGFVLRGGPSRRQSVMSSAHMHSMLARSCVREGSTIITLNGHEPVSYGAYDGTNPFA